MVSGIRILRSPFSCFTDYILFFNYQKMSKTIKKKQPTLAAFGYTKKVKHRGEEIAIEMSLEAVETLFECGNCEK